MIFKQMEPVRLNKKTQTRRVVKHNEVSVCDEAHQIVEVAKWAKPGSDKWFACKWAVGRDYAAVPKMYQKAFGRIRIEAIRQERLHDITEADAIAEGVASVEEYKALWESINGKTKGARWDDNPEVWVITFRYLGDVEP